MGSDQVLNQINTYFKEVLHRGLGKKGLIFPIDLNRVEDDNLKEICSRLAVIFEMINESYQCSGQLSQGKLDSQVSRTNIFGMPLKALQASLAHLTWQVNQVADGDLSQKVHFLGSFSNSFNRMISSLKKKKILEQQIMEKNIELENAIKELKMLSGIVPICMHCKKIRDDRGYWNQLEKFLTENSDAQFSHGICDDCLKEQYPDED